MLWPVLKHVTVHRATPSINNVPYLFSAGIYSGFNGILESCSKQLLIQPDPEAQIS